MKARALELAAAVDDVGQRLSVLREYMQASILRSLHDSEAFGALSFVGGRALRFLYGLHRYSEDLGFSVENRSAFDPDRWWQRLERDLRLAGSDASLTWNDSRTVHIGWVRVDGLLREAGLAPLPAQKLSVKVECDTRPPAGAVTASRAVNRHFLVAFRHHDLPSLMAGKDHVLIARPYAKGRDWYDLMWYRSRPDPVDPNPELLQAALDQTEGAGAHDAAGWRNALRGRLQDLDMRAPRGDVAPFVERPGDADLLTAQHLGHLLSEP